jgi:hypothetical protein
MWLLCPPRVVKAVGEPVSITTKLCWHIRSREINDVVMAEDQWEAWDTLRDRSAFDFGLVVSAEKAEDGDPIPVQTASLMRRWGRFDDAALLDEVARAAGLLT